jgi:hypothetical protein
MITPWYETMYQVMREAMAEVREQEPVSIYDDIRSMSKNQLRLYVRNNKHMGYFNKPTNKWTKLEWSTCQKVTYAKNRLRYAFN